MENTENTNEVVATAAPKKSLFAKKEKKEDSPKKAAVKKVLNAVANALALIICIFVVVLAVATISSSGKGYTSMFGNAYLTVASESMSGTFEKGDIIKVKEVAEEDKDDLKVGDIISFWDVSLRDAKGNNVINTHRITAVVEMDGEKFYRTKGDNNENADSTLRSTDKVVGVYVKKFNSIGKFMLFIHTEVGFGVCVILPGALLLAYCLVVVIMSAIGFNRKRFAQAKAQMLEEAKTSIETDSEIMERLKQEALEQARAELLKEQKAAAEAKSADVADTDATAAEEPVADEPENK